MTVPRLRSTVRLGRRPWLLIALFAALLAVPAASTVQAQPEMAPPANPKEAKKYKKLVEGARAYFDLNEDSWSGRKRFEVELNKLAASGQYPLADVDFLSWLVGQSRSFLPPLNDRKWAKANGIDVSDRGGWGYELKGEGKGDQKQLWAHIREPGEYVDKPTRFKDFPRKGPWPVVLALHSKRHPDAPDGAGRAWLETNWDKKTHADLFKNWFVVMPIVAAARYSENGLIRVDKVYGILRAFWQRYHMDYDRVVLDGNTDAVLFASTNGTNLFSGLVIRDLDLADGKLASAKLAASIKNIAHMPVYVVNKPKVAKALKDAGLQDVTEGDEKASLVKWMSARRRVMPSKFSWTIADKDQRVAYWVNIDQPLWEAKVRTLDVEVTEGNAIDIKAIGVSEISLFLDDHIVDLDEAVKVTINGTLVHDKKIEPRLEKYAPIKRDLREIFEQPPVHVRKYRYYGWLKTGSIVRMTVPPPPKEDEGGEVTPQEKASPKEEANAEKYMVKAKAGIKDGDNDYAMKYLKKILELPFNKQTEEARKLKDKIENEANEKK